ncbi:S41 family peptidase [Duganella vulcania]|uniref:Tail specific protease domain-containing protein n=1 Tax=Duganella vulcania TaxID=2692166 RepID=A0A845GLE8_9BURK|nr:S41 family peptidase [Duganella vulcania]MYM94290.1 hypothetical protein [Duganella vulcania]
MKTLLAAALLLTASTTACAFERKDWLDDYAALKTALEQRYANLAWFASPQGGVDLPALDQRTRRLLDTAEDESMAKAALSAFVSGFHDGHFSSAGSVLQPKIAQPLALPKVDYSRLSATQACAALGYGPVRGAAFSLPFESLPGTVLEADGLTRAFRSGVVAAPDGTRFGVVRIARFRQQDASPAACEQAWSERQAKGAMSEADVKPVKQAANAAWLRTLAAQLRRFHEQKVAAVIVDVGGNPGGNDTGDWAVRLFTARDVHSARMMMSAAPLAAMYFDEQLDGLRQAQKEQDPTPEARAMLEQSIAAFEARKAGIAARDCDLSWAWSEQRPWKPNGCSRLIDAGYASGQASYLPPRAFGNLKIASSIYWAAEVDDLRGAWNGPVYVLTDGGTGSSAEMFSALMQDAAGARIVGRASAGDGCGFMADAPPVVLPHSHLRYRVPNCVRLRADGSDEVAGVRPDLPVLPAEGENDRERAWRLMDTVAADLRARSAKP